MAVKSTTSRLYLLLCLSSFIILLLSSSLVQAQTLKYCDKNADYVVKVSGVEILPNPAVRGEPFTFKIAAYTGEPIQSGDLIYEVSIDGVEAPLGTFLHDLCEESSCPVPVGGFLLTHTELLPTFTPAGTYNMKVKLTFKDQNGKQLSCIIFPFIIGAGSSVSAI